jgi:hypothetical protein
MAHHYLILINTFCLSMTRSDCLFISIHPPPSHIAVLAVVAVTLLSPSPLPLSPHKLSPLLPPPLPPSPLHRLLPLPSTVGCCLSRVPIHPSITVSQSRFLQEENSKKIHQAGNKAAINVAIVDLVAARKVRHADGGKRLIRSNHSYKNVITSLQSVGVDITYDALMKRVARATVEDSIAEIRIPNLSTESVVSSLLSPRKQADDSLTSENTAETTSHEDPSLKTPELAQPQLQRRQRWQRSGCSAAAMAVSAAAQWRWQWQRQRRTLLLASRSKRASGSLFAMGLVAFPRLCRSNAFLYHSALSSSSIPLSSFFSWGVVVRVWVSKSQSQSSISATRVASHVA